MTTILVTSKDGPEEFRYSSEIAPRIGETLTILDAGRAKILKVIAVDHFFKAGWSGELGFEQLTVTVERRKP